MGRICKFDEKITINMQNSNIQYTFCENDTSYEKAKALFIEYAESLGFDLCFQGFEEELQQLASKYGKPEGALIIAEIDGQAIGCVGLRKLPDESVELKRLYVKPAFRKLKIGEELMQLAIQEAKHLGYKKLKLDTLDHFTPAITLYQKLGFYKIEPYNYNPFDNVVYMALDL